MKKWKVELPENPNKVLANIRNFERELMQNKMGTLKDLDETDYFELMNVWEAEEAPESLSDFLSKNGAMGG